MTLALKRHFCRCAYESTFKHTKTSGDFQRFRWEWWCRSVWPLLCIIQDTSWYRYDTRYPFKPLKWDSQMDWFYLDHQEGASLTVEVLPSSVRGDPNAKLGWFFRDAQEMVPVKFSPNNLQDLERTWKSMLNFLWSNASWPCFSFTWEYWLMILSIG